MKHLFVLLFLSSFALSLSAGENSTAPGISVADEQACQAFITQEPTSGKVLHQLLQRNPVLLISCDRRRICTTDDDCGWDGVCVFGDGQGNRRCTCW